jgi:Peptidase family M28
MIPLGLALLVAFPGDDPLPASDPAVTEAALEHHVRFLASDEMLGRASGTAESTRVSDYIARSLTRSGVKPAGAPGQGYFQPVPLVITEFEAAPELRLDDRLLTDYGVSFSVRFHGDPKDTGELRTLVVKQFEDLPAEPDPAVALVMASSRARSTKWLESRGQDDGLGWGLIVRVKPDREAGRAQRKPRRAVSTPERAREDRPEQVTVYGALATELWEGEIERLTLISHGERRRVDERNVVGLVPGVGTPESPELAKEVIVLSAHFDHIGVASGDPADGKDLIHNGADDDASGTAVLLELAEAFAAGEPPARTVLMLFCAAEEHGMLGTYHWADNPTVPLETIVCNLNIEMLGMPDPIMGGDGGDGGEEAAGKPWLTGFERSNLGPSFQAAGLDIGRDLRPKMNFFSRSDNIVFVRKGIVGQTISTGGDNPNYHKVGDEADTLDFGHMHTCAELTYRAARLLAVGQVTPTWNPGEPDLKR